MSFQNLMLNKTPPGKPGMIADGSPKTLVTGVSGHNMPYGLFVTGTKEAMTLPSKANDKIIGIVTSDASMPVNVKKIFDDLDLPYYLPGRAVNLLKKGRVWVPVGEVVAEGDPVHVKFKNTTNTPKGIAVKTADQASTIELENARFVSANISVPVSAKAPTVDGSDWSVSQTVTTLSIALVELN